MSFSYMHPSLVAEDALDGIASDLADQGLAIRDGLLPPDLIDRLAAEGQARWAADDPRPALIGRGQERHANATIRTDRILWLDPATATPAQGQYLAFIADLRLAINRRLFLGLFEFEGHLAVYPPGAFYRKHLDRFRGTEQRLVTAILYLNPDWREEDGGQLRLYPDPNDDGRYQDLLPLAGRLVCFLSGDFPHEVLPARRDRLSITGWYRKRD